MEYPDQSLRSLSSAHSNTGASHVTEHRKARQQRRHTNGSLQTGGLIPVILSTDKLIFNREQGVNEKTLTLYNPFEFEIDYKLYTTAPRKYSVRNAEGSVQPHFCVDILITRRSIEDTKGYADNLQIKIFSNQACIGKKDLPVFINISEDSLQTEITPSEMNGVKSKTNKKGNEPGLFNKKLPWLPIALTTVSLVVLVIPLEGWPCYSAINYNHKLIAAFLIGIIIGRYWR